MILVVNGVKKNLHPVIAAKLLKSGAASFFDDSNEKVKKENGHKKIVKKNGHKK